MIIFKLLKPKVIEIISPMTGKAISITEVPDPVFAEKMIGDGVAIEPTDGLVVSPCKGKVVQIFPSNHAIGIEIKQGVDLLVHLGIDTVELNGQGFKRLVEQGQEVKVGTPLIKMDLGIIAGEGKSIISPIIITTMDKIRKMDTTTGSVRAGKDVIMKIKIKQ
ncbi:MAG TPA: PTS glucose transporter subunit IIA [Epulopiscium sp.]|nr:PTS glucose transporter subunit IIA [Candidatus Epulonipiscium sp.]